MPDDTIAPPIEIAIGHHVKGQPTPQQVSTVQLLWLEERVGLLSVLLPEGGTPEDKRVFVPFPGKPALDLGDLDERNTDGRLAILKISDEHLSDITTMTPISGLAADAALPLPEGILMEQSLHDYLRGANLDQHTVRCIARYVSSQNHDVSGKGLPEVLALRTFADLIRTHPAYTRTSVPRDPRLAKELWETVEKRRIAFVSGGSKSGLSEFLEQFKATLSCSGTHLAADFQPRTFEDVVSVLQNNSAISAMLDQPRPGALETASLFISLAYSAYKSLIDAPRVDLASLGAFVSPRAASSISHFVVEYMSAVARLTASRGDTRQFQTQVESFLLYVGTLMESAGRGETLTVILSFARLVSWLREVHDNEAASHVSKFLWDELGTFTTNNYSVSTGAPLPSSLIATFSHNIGVLIETQRLPIPEATDGFCRHCILTIPPFDRAELASLWVMRTSTKPNDDILDSLERYTGGAPWFAELVLDCFESQKNDKKPGERLTAAIEMAKKIIQSGEAAGSTFDAIGSNWALYVSDLKQRFSQGTLSNKKALLDLRRAAQNFLTKPPSLQMAEWLESGLIWLKHSQGLHTLRALETYPHLLTYPVPRLIDWFIEDLTEMETTS